MKILRYLVLLLAVPAWANQSSQGFCTTGNQKVTTSGIISTTTVQASYPQCTVTIYNHGTVTLATIYSDNNTVPTPLGNPFTATTTGSWQFYAANGHYDVVLSGSGFPSPSTTSDVLLFDPLAAGLVYPQWFGAACDGTTDDIIAFNSAITYLNTVNGGTLVVPSVCKIASPLVITGNNITLAGYGAIFSQIKFTGTGVAVKFGSPAASATYYTGNAVRDLAISGTATSTFCLQMRQQTDGYVSNVRAMGCPTVGFEMEGIVSFNLINLRSSQNEGAFTPLTASGLIVTASDLPARSQNVVVTNGIFDHTTVVGAKVDSGSFVHFMGGTSESGALGYQTTINSGYVIFDSTDAEANSGNNYDISGVFHRIYNATAANSAVEFKGGGSQGSVIYGGLYDSITVDAGASDISLTYANFNQSLGTGVITDNGTRTTICGMVNKQTGVLTACSMPALTLNVGPLTATAGISAPAAGAGQFGASASYGAMITGSGTLADAVITNRATTIALQVNPGTADIKAPAGTIEAVNGFISGASVGATTGVVVKGSLGANCTLNFKGGLFISTTCP